jgi:hypothetical protein
VAQKAQEVIGLESEGNMDKLGRKLQIAIA